MIIKIVGAGENHFSSLYTPSANEYIIGVDGGLNVLLSLGIKVDLAIGDFDSFNKRDVKAELVKTYNAKKDLSDLALALDFAVKQNHQKIIVYNVTGGRLDHYYSALNELVRYRDYNIEILNDQNKIYLRSGTFEINKDDYKYVSFFAIDEAIITLENFKYPLTNYQLTKMDNLCLSNEIIHEVGKVSSSRPIIVIQSK